MFHGFNTTLSLSLTQPHQAHTGYKESRNMQSYPETHGKNATQGYIGLYYANRWMEWNLSCNASWMPQVTHVKGQFSKGHKVLSLFHQ